MSMYESCITEIQFYCDDDYVLERKNGLNLYNKILEKIDKSYLNDMDIEIIAAMNYTKEIGNEFIG